MFFVDLEFKTFENRAPTKILEIKNASEKCCLGRDYSQYAQKKGVKPIEVANARNQRFSLIFPSQCLDFQRFHNLEILGTPEIENINQECHRHAQKAPR